MSQEKLEQLRKYSFFENLSDQEIIDQYNHILKVFKPIVTLVSKAVDSGQDPNEYISPPMVNDRAFATN